MISEQGSTQVLTLVVPVTVSATALLLTPVAIGDDAGPIAQPSVISKEVKRPPKVVHRKAKLKIPSRPTVEQVGQMIRYEAALWGVPAASLERRARCESGLRWWASNGPYQGVLQFHPGTFRRGLQTIQTLRVKIKDAKIRRMHSRVYFRWSTGRVTRSKGRVVRQRVLTTRVGRLGTNAINPWTQIRIGAQALRGISAVRSSEWSCGA